MNSANNGTLTPALKRIGKMFLYYFIHDKEKNITFVAIKRLKSFSKNTI